MKIENITTTLEIDESPELHERAWKAQPYAWLVIYLFVLAGILGLFGTGPLSRREVSKGEASIRYERVYRQGATARMDFFDASGTNPTVITFPMSFLSRFSVESIVPQPIETTISKSGMNYVFKGDAALKKITFYFMPGETGRLSTDILVNAHALKISNTILP